MRKIFGLLSLTLVLASCSEEIKNSTPGFQAKKDNVFWRATDASAHVNADGSLTISAYNSSSASEQLILNTSSADISSKVNIKAVLCIAQYLTVITAI